MPRVARRSHGVFTLAGLIVLAWSVAALPQTPDSKIVPAVTAVLTSLEEQESRGLKPGELLLPPNAHIDPDRRLRVVVLVTSVSSDVIEALRARGAIIESQAAAIQLVQARIPVDRVREVAALDAVRSIRLPSHGRTNAQGSVATEGEPVVRADVARALFGVNGTGIRVGVISDGIAIVTLAASSGNLPPTQIIRDETGLPIASEGGVTGKSFRADNALQGPLGSPLAEGTALLEIVHDLAPGAQLFFAAISTDVEFASAVEWLAEEAGGPNARRGTVGGVDVIINDFSFLDLGPVDGSNPAAQVAANAVNQGVVFVTAVGNFADRHHRAMFSDPDGNRFHNFAGTDESIRVSVPGRASLVAVLRWDDPWDASTNDYDLRLFDTDGNPVPIGGGSARQIGTGPPFELVSYFNGSTSARSLDIRIENFEGRAAPRLLSLFVLGTGAPIDHNVPLGSVAPPADAHGVISVGAVRSDSPGTIEAFSGQGPTLDGRLKPELVAPDRVSTSVFGGGSFVGTSAAAPHVGAVAALLLSLDPTLTPEKVQRALEVSSTDVGAAGPDPASGFGLVNALAALGLPRADIGLNQSSYSIGDTLILDLLARSGSTLNRGDAYLVALTPTGQLVSLVLEGDGHLHLTEGLVPMQRGFSVLDIEGAIYARRFVASDPRGTYVVFAVLVREGRDPLDHSNWIVFDIEEYALGGVALPQRAGADPPR